MSSVRTSASSREAPDNRRIVDTNRGTNRTTGVNPHTR